MRACADRDSRDQPACPRANRIHLGVVASRQPQHAAVRRHIAHVRTASAGNVPLVDDLARAKGNHRHAALVAVGDVEHLAVPSDHEAVGARSGVNEADHLESGRIDLPHAACREVGDIEHLRVG